MSAISEAIENDSVVKMKALIQEDVDLHKPIVIGEEYELEDRDTISPFFYAIRKYASMEMIELLLANGIDLFEVDGDGISALDIAIKFRRKDVIMLCIQKGFDLNSTKRKSGITPVMLASCFSDIEMMEMLIGHGADVNRVDKGGMSAKDYARKVGQTKMVEFLSTKGAKFNLYPQGE